MSLPLPLAAGANLFSQPITAYDEVFSLVNGRAQTVTEPDRTIYGVIQTRGDKRVTLGSDGALSDGGLLLHTTHTVSAADVSQEGTTNRQTYVKYRGEVWKLFELANWKDKAQNYNKYRLTKYTKIL